MKGLLIHDNTNDPEISWLIEKSVNRYGVAMYLDITQPEVSRQVTLPANTWVDIAMTFIVPQMNGFSFNGTELTCSLDLDTRIVLMPIKVNGYASVADATIEANMYINEVACSCGGGRLYLKSADDHGYFGFTAYKDDMVVGDKINFRMKSTKAQTFTLSSLQFTIEIQ